MDITFTPVGGGAEVVQRNPKDKISRWALLAMIWQIENLHGGQSPESFTISEAIRSVAGSAEDQDQITVEDALMGLGSGEHPHVQMYMSGVVLFNPEKPEEILGPEAMSYYRDLVEIAQWLDNSAEGP